MQGQTNKESAWVRVQIQLFTLWMNEVLEQRNMGVQDLAVDLKDGIRVINFFELLSGVTLKEKYDLRPKNRIQMVHNLHLAIQFLEREMHVRNPGCFAEDIVDADTHGVKLILGLLYTLYRKYRMSALVDKKKGKVKEEDALLEWIREVTEDYGVEVQNFKTSFRDGKVYLALAHVISGGEFDYNEFKNGTSLEVLEKAFSVAETHNIHRLLLVDEVSSGDIDERALVLYTSLYHHEYLKKKEMESLKGEVGKNQEQLELEAKSKEDLVKLNVELQNSNLNLLRKRNTLKSLQERGTELDGILAQKKELLGKIELEKNDAEVGLKGAEVLFQQLTEKFESFTAVGEDDKDEIEELIKEIEETKKKIEEIKAKLKEMKEKDGESFATKYVEAQKKASSLQSRKEELVEEIEELEEEVSVLKKTVQTATDDCNEDKNELQRANDLQKLYLDFHPLEANLRAQIVDLHKWAPYLKSQEGFGVEDDRTKELKQPKEGDYKEVFKSMAGDLEKENDDIGKVLVQLKKDQLKKDQKKAAKASVKKPTIKKEKK
ncbi:Alpha-actinin [Entamoeba marina]